MRLPPLLALSDRQFRLRGLSSETSAARRVRAAEKSKILTGGKYEIFTLDCSPRDVDRRDIGLVNRTRLLRRRRLLPRRLLHLNVPIKRAV